MKIVFDARIHLPVITGMSRYIVNLLGSLLKIDQENTYVVLINPNLSPEDEIFELKKHANLAFKVLDLPHMGIVNYTKMRKVIRELKPDIYHYPHLDAPIVKGIKTVATIHDANLSGDIKKFDDRFGLKSLYFKKTLSNTLKKSNAILFISNAIREEVLKTYKMQPDNKYKVIYNGFDQQFGEISVEAMERVKSKFKLSKPYFLYVGQMRHHKNVIRLIESFLKTGSDWELIMVGKNYMNLDFSNYPSNVRYLSMVSEEELKGLYGHSQAFVFPSFIEGFGFPILESLSYGKPIIGTNYGAVAEIGGKFLTGIDPADGEDITEKLAAFMHAQPDFPSLDECKTYVNHFNWDTCAKEVLEVYKELHSA